MNFALYLIKYPSPLSENVSPKEQWQWDWVAVEARGEKNVIRLLTCCEMGELVILCVTSHVMASYVSATQDTWISSADGITTEVIKMLK